MVQVLFVGFYIEETIFNSISRNTFCEYAIIKQES